MPHTPSPLPDRDADAQAQLDAALIDLFESRVRFNKVLGLEILSVKPGDVRGRIAMRPELVGHYLYGRLHGGVISATLDAMGGLALMVEVATRHRSDDVAHVMQRFARFGTIDLRVDYLRPGLGQHFIVSTEVTRLGGRVGSVQMRMVNDEGVLIATGTGAYMVS